MPKLSARDRDIAIKTILGEAANQGPDGMGAVAQVLENRLNAGGYGDSLADVALQPGQFSAWNGKTGYAGGEGANDLINISGGKSYESAAAALDRVFNSDGDPTGGATNYWAPSGMEGGRDPYWAKGHDNRVKIGDQIFLAKGKPSDWSPTGGYLGNDPSIGPVMPLGGLTGGTSFSTGGGGGGGFFDSLIGGFGSVYNAIPGIKTAATDAIGGLIEGGKPIVGKIEGAVRDKVMENPISAFFNLGPFAGVFGGGMGGFGNFGQSRPQMEEGLRQRGAANSWSTARTLSNQKPITYNHKPVKSAGERTDVMGNDMAFMPLSHQMSSRWNTGY